jgi:ABC-2 type transport system ATP-binding protein
MRIAVLAAGLTAATCLAAAPAHAADYNTLASFDGTPITFYWFPAVGLAPGQTAPTVLQGPGFGGQAQSNPDAPDGGPIPGVGTLRQAGYNVLTWNPRGISPSGGEAMLDNPNYEGRDVQALIDWVGQQPQAQLDAPGDPRVGMTGGSYGGGIQFSTAGIDARLDAIVPVIAWNSLDTALYKADTIKTAWVNVLMTGATRPGNTFAPALLKGREEAKKGLTFSKQVVDFATSAGPFQVVPNIKTPTFIIQGTVDNLFPPSEAVANYTLLKKTGVPLKMTWYCGGHGFCLENDGSTKIALEQTSAWLDKYLKGSAVDTGAAFTWVDQNGTYRSAADYPQPASWLKATGKGTLTLQEKGGSGPYAGKLPDGVNPLAAVLLRQTLPSPAVNAVSVPVKATKTSVVLGTPKLTLKYSGTSKAKQVRVLAQLVDPKHKTVLGHQITPIPLKLNGKPQTVKVPLETISGSLKKGKGFTLQIVAQSTAYNVFPKKGAVTFTKVKVALPVVG